MSGSNSPNHNSAFKSFLKKTKTKVRQEVAINSCKFWGSKVFLKGSSLQPRKAVILLEPQKCRSAPRCSVHKPALPHLYQTESESACALHACLFHYDSVWLGRTLEPGSFSHVTIFIHYKSLLNITVHIFSCHVVPALMFSSHCKYSCEVTVSWFINWIQ